MRFLFFLLFFLSPFVFSIQPNPPSWPESVSVFDPDDSATTQKTIDSIFAVNGGNQPANNGQFSPYRYALLFKPGYHNVTVNVGYYTSVIGLGGSPKDVNIREVTVQNGDYDYTVGALDNFWRSGENFYTNPTAYWNEQSTPSMMWAVSQASPLRRVYVDGNLNLYQFNFGCCAGYASGGYMSNSYVAGVVDVGSQQQWFSRNSYFGGWYPAVGNWNIVSVGCSGGVPRDNCLPYVSYPDSPVIAEKPFIIISDDGKYSLAIPPVETEKVGPSDWDTDGGLANHEIVDFSNVFVATPDDTVSTINSMLSQMHVILTPGQYNLTDTIVINTANRTLLGIGFPTLISLSGAPCVEVRNVEGVRVGGILFQASSLNTPSLFQWGLGSYTGNTHNPGFVYDLFARVGGTNNQSVEQVGADKMAIINSDNVVIDGSWLWRADHGVGGEVYNGDNPCYTGLLVAGEYVTSYGLAVEHTLQDLVQWNGDNGKIFFFQSEFPYDVAYAYGEADYTALRIDSRVVTLAGYGVGAYSNFQNTVYVESGIKVDSNSEFVTFTQAFIVFLNGFGGIVHVVNREGDGASTVFTVTPLCQYN